MSHRGPDQKLKRNHHIGLLLFPVAFAIASMLMGYSAGASSASSNESAVRHFGYTGSQLVATFAPPKGSFSPTHTSA